MKSQEKGGDFVNFRLKKDGPNYVALGKARFTGQFRREEEPFRATRGEWKVFLEKAGYFELIDPQIPQITQRVEREEGGPDEAEQSVQSAQSAD